MEKQVIRQHTSFIKFIYSSVLVPESIQDLVEDIGFFKYRHMCWAMEESVREGEEFGGTFAVDEVAELKKLKTQRELVNYLISDLETNLRTYSNDNLPTIARFKNDDLYFLEQLKEIKEGRLKGSFKPELNRQLEEPITAFSQKGKLKGVELTSETKNALIFFLMEEIFKEYELILIYSFYKTYSQNSTTNSVFTDLAYDSIYHLKRFAQLAKELGVLTLPRPIPLKKYRSEDIIQFLKENIEEERGAEKNCLILAEKIGNDQLRDFLLFISRQEVYHAYLLERALATLKEKK